jgi:PAS domain S-box-containing protein
LLPTNHQALSLSTDPAVAALEAKNQELKLSLALMRASFETTNDAILVTTADRKVSAYNEQYSRMFHLPRDLAGRCTHDEILTRVADSLERPDEVYARIAEIRNGLDEATDEIRLRDGRLIERFTTVQMLDGQPVGRIWRFRDISDRAKAEHLQARLAAIVESSDDAIISKTLQSIITTWNKGAERIFGYTSEEAVGKSILMLIPPERAEEETAIIARLRAGEHIDHYETIRVRKDGQPIHISLTISPVHDSQGRVIGASKIARDITQQKLAEERLRRNESELRALLEEREVLLSAERAARSEAERISIMKDEFLATLSHELRTPLNAILGWSQLLSGGKLQPAEVAQGIEAIERNARVQTQLIEDLLDMSRIISGKVRLDVQWSDLANIIDTAMRSVQPSADVKNITLRPILDSRASPVMGDPTRLQQVIWNLLTNAIKFTPKGGKIDIFLRRIDSHLEIMVRDSGIGIKPEFLPLVFERFRQADASTTRSFGGLGLGLSIVKHLVELHGGTVRAESAGEGQGATFTVKLPLAPTSFGQQRAPSGNHSPEYSEFSLQGVKVLIVDDEPDARALLERVLTQYHAVVSTADSADQGLVVLRDQMPDVLVSDIGMPHKDGYQFIREVRRLAPENGGRVPAIALTAFARSEDRTRAMIAGYQVHIAKPIEPQELAVTVGSLAGRTGM